MPEQECDIIGCESHATFQRHGAAGEMWLCGSCRNAFEAGRRKERHEQEVRQ